LRHCSVPWLSGRADRLPGSSALAKRAPACADSSRERKPVAKVPENAFRTAADASLARHLQGLQSPPPGRSHIASSADRATIERGARLALNMGMQFMESLNEEHNLIMAVLDALEAYATRLEHGTPVDDHELLRFVVFLSDFADGWHHAKEEDVLLAAMTRHGFASDSGVLVHLRDQHVREREIFRKLKRAAAAAAVGSRTVRFVDVAKELVAFERSHIRKETELFYPAAERELSTERRGQLDKEMARFARTHAPGGHLEWLWDLGEQLVRDHGTGVALAASGVARRQMG
jgi:hemerythrin-like domain-containing protein